MPVFHAILTSLQPPSPPKIRHPPTNRPTDRHTQVFLLAGDLVKPEAAHTLMQLVAEGTGEDEAADDQLRRDAVSGFYLFCLNLFYV